LTGERSCIAKPSAAPVSQPRLEIAHRIERNLGTKRLGPELQNVAFSDSTASRPSHTTSAQGQLEHRYRVVSARSTCLILVVLLQKRNNDYFQFARLEGI
jgi:hypothetical protein